MIEEKRIAIFQAYYPVISQLGYMAKVLSEEGFHVDLFLHKCTMDIFQIFEEKGITVHQIDIRDTKTSKRETQVVTKRVESWLKKIKRHPLAIQLRILWRRLTPESMLPGGIKLIPSTLLEEALDRILDENYICLIGVEKAGLIWAGLIGERTGLPWIYHSLELYTSDHDFYYKHGLVRYRRAEKLYHQKAIATIIQDQDRADVLFKDNEIQNGKAIFVPVSIMGECAEVRSDYLRAKHNIPQNKVVVLQFGQINERRLCEEVMHEARNFNEDTILVMQGMLTEDKEKYMHVTSSGRVILSGNLIPRSEVEELINSADIGLVFYREHPLNDYLTGSASEKLALYLQAGVPVIMFDYPSFRQLNDKYQFGVCIRRLEELGQAIATILNNYSYYRNNAFSAFTDHYEFRRGFEKTLEFIKSLNS